MTKRLCVICRLGTDPQKRASRGYLSASRGGCSTKWDSHPGSALQQAQRREPGGPGGVYERGVIVEDVKDRRSSRDARCPTTQCAGV